MTAIFRYNILLTAGGVLLLAATAMAAYLAEPFWLLAPFACALITWLLLHPKLLFDVLLFAIPWSAEFQFSSGFGTDLPDEPLMLLMAFSAVMMTILQRNQWVKKKTLHPLLLLLLLQLIWLGVSVAFSTHVVFSVKYFLAKAWYLLAFVAAPLLYWHNTVSIKRSFSILLVSMLLVTSVTLFRHAITGFHFSTINTALEPFFRNHVNYSALLVFMLPLQVLLWHEAKSKPIRRILLYSFFITLPALYFSFARGAWLAFLLGMIAYWLLKRKWLFQTFLFTVLLIVSLFFWLRNNDRYLQFAHDYQTTIFHQNFEEHWAATYQLKDMSTAERFYRWVAAVRMMEDSWQTGFGPTTFYQHYKSYTIPAFKTWVSKNDEQSTVHNYFLLLAIEQGAPGLLLFLLLLGLLFWYAQKIYHRTTVVFWKRMVAAIAAILVMECTLNFLSDLIETDKVGSVFYMCIAALIVADRKTKQLSQDVNVEDK